MDFFSFHEQNWDNFIVLLTALSLTVFTTFVNNRFSALRFHNLTKLGNEIISRCIQVFIGFYPTLALLIEGSNLGKKVMTLYMFLSAAGWIASLFATEHITTKRIKKSHPCVVREGGSPDICDYEMKFSEVIKISGWNILLFAITFVLATGISFSKMACGTKCIPPNPSVSKPS